MRAASPTPSDSALCGKKRLHHERETKKDPEHDIMEICRKEADVFSDDGGQRYECLTVEGRLISVSELYLYTKEKEMLKAFATDKEQQAAK